MTRARQTPTFLPAEQLAVHPGNIRDDLGDLTDMARSIREHGILQPLTVTEHPTQPDVYRIIDGHRRFNAARLVDEPRIPAIIRHNLVDENEQTIIMLVTGVHRRELSPIERARGYGRLHDAGLNMSEIARRVGCKPSTVSYYLNLLRLDEDTLEKVETGDLPVADAVAAVRQTRQADRAAAGTPPRGRPPAYFGSEHPLAPTVAQRCKHLSNYGGIRCGPCWEQAIREDALRSAA